MVEDDFEKKEDYSIVLLSGEEITPDYDTHFYFVHRNGRNRHILHFLMLVTFITDFQYIYITKILGDIKSASRLIPISSIAEYKKSI